MLQERIKSCKTNFLLEVNTLFEMSYKKDVRNKYFRGIGHN
jgi:hypothetical protein